MKAMKYVLCGMLLAAIVVLTGCTNVVRATVSPSEFAPKDLKTPATVALHVTDEYRTFKGKHVDWWCDATSYTMEIGPLASDWFQYAMENQFENVIVGSGQPEFPYANPEVDFVVTPEFTSFKAGGPVVVKLEKYWVELGMSAKIQDARGNVLDTLELKERGEQGGTPGFNPGTHVYPEVCRKAVKPLVDKTVARLVELSNSD
jgi:hypothetical protein